MHVIDGSEPLHETDQKHLNEADNKKRVVVINKSDLGNNLRFASGQPSHVSAVSCTSGAGIEELKDAIKALLWSGNISSENLQVMINSRHQDALRRASDSTRITIDALKNNISLDLASIDLRIAVDAIGEVVGKTTTEDILDSIFSQFCIGK